MTNKSICLVYYYLLMASMVLKREPFSLEASARSLLQSLVRVLAMESNTSAASCLGSVIGKDPSLNWLAAAVRSLAFSE